MKDQIEINKDGYPILPNGEIDWEQVKEFEFDYYNSISETGSGIKRRKNTSLTPKKKKRK